MLSTSLKIAIIGAMLCAIVFGASASEPVTVKPPENDFLAKAAGAFKAVQVRVKADPILRPLAETKKETGDSSSVWSDGMPVKSYKVKGKFVVFSAQTPEVFEFPIKGSTHGATTARGHGRLVIKICENLPGRLAGTPFMPLPGCYCGNTYLSMSGTPAKVLVETVTSDRSAQRRLVEMMIEELAKVGITAKPKLGENPENIDSIGSPLAQPPLIGAQPGAPQPTRQPPASQPQKPERAESHR